VAVNARQIAKFAQIELEDLGAIATESQPVICQCPGESLPGPVPKFRRSYTVTHILVMLLGSKGLHRRRCILAIRAFPGQSIIPPMEFVRVNADIEQTDEGDIKQCAPPDAKPPKAPWR
jgi:hypothetical protein